ncbi:nitrite/sulfite reductase [Nitrogeniibacter mangrovi]|uniref:Nitrite/sulfite reductase n=1 Tax=Nitrogeniibacter mangrovi TaxID=2016596 RepID=A0A6C1B2Z9_9RHOO|nr:nitrite/sulfite reductase [Nitrogeniibacter mangrovi]QID16710.1 nitrite/sulfite reductase [Nitrogeniibacter mangrovi]
MYRYDEYDQQLVDERVKQFADQTRRYLAGELSEDEFLPLRLQNGLYVQKHAPMLRIAIPYGNLRSDQVRMFAHIARTYDKGYAHFSTRQNIQYNWPKLEDVPEILGKLASVQIHAIQTSGNCIRNTTSDPFAGVAGDELIDPRPWCELIRQWSTFHPEFAYLPRKFKMAVNGAEEDRAVIRCHDIGLEVRHNAAGETGFRIFVGGGLGRTPMVGEQISDFVPWPHLLSYLEAILRVYNRFGRRDNKFKARIKILVKALGIDAFREQVEAEWAHLKDGPSTLSTDEVARIAACFVDPQYESLPATDAGFERARAESKPFAKWVERNVRGHKRAGYASVVVSLKKTGVPPGDITAEQLDLVAAWADRYSFGEVRVTHEQNLVFADVKRAELFELWEQLREAALATPNFGLLTDMICCPGGDFCNLANAKSIPIAESVQRRFDDLDYLHDIGELELNISGCMNACGHHHVGHIGILGVDKNGEEWYQITIGGRQGNDAGIGKVIGRSFAAADVPDVIEALIDTYIDHRHEGERFVDTVHRIGLDPFKARVYGEQQTERKVANG